LDPHYLGSWKEKFCDEKENLTIDKKTLHIKDMMELAVDVLNWFTAHAPPQALFL